MPEQKEKKSLKSIHFLFRYMLQYKWHFLGGLILLVVSSVTFMIIMALAGEMAKAATGKSTWPLSVTDYGYIFMLLLVGQGFVSYFRVWLFAIVSERSMADVRNALFKKLVALDLTFFEQQKTGDLTNRITTDVEQLQNAFSVTLAEFIRQLVLLVGGLVYIFILTPRLSVTMLFVFPMAVVLAVVFGKLVRQYAKERQDVLATSNVRVEESLQSFLIVKMFTNEWLEIKRYIRSMNDLVGVSLRYSKVKGAFFSFIIVILFGAIVFVLWRGALMVERGDMLLADLTTFIIFTTIVGGAIAALGNHYTTLLGALGAADRIQEILSQPSEFNMLEQEESHPSLVLNESIRYKDLSFSYPSRPDIEVLKKIDFEVKKGEKIALVGPSGSGKTTIVKLLCALYPIHPKAITIDQTDITEIHPLVLRQLMGFVPQDIILFSGSVFDNIRYGNHDTDEHAVIEAAKKANVMEFAEKLSEGIHTIVGEKGVQLSGGQRQRIAIARAILKNPEILILDEATSALDTESERLVQEALENVMEGRTTFIIAHRLSTIRHVDTIFVINDGKIIESGKHDELMNKEKGMYKNLVELQYQTSKTTDDITI